MKILKGMRFMRLKIALSAVTVFFVLSIAFIPSMILSSITKVNITYVKSQTYQNTIHCNGEIIEKRVKEIYLETPVIASQINVEIGDRVYKGQKLAAINTELTQTALAQGTSVSALDNEQKVLNNDISALAARYGFTQEDVQSVMTEYKNVPVQQNKAGFIPHEINAPMDGVITAVNMQTDVLTLTTKPVLVVSDDSAYIARVSVNEADVAKIQVGDQAFLTGVGFGGKHYTAVVSKIYPTARRIISGTVQQTVVDVELSIKNVDKGLKPGYSTKAVIATQPGREMITVPYEAVQQQEDNREYVFVYFQNRLQKRYIKTGKELSNSVEVTEGLTQNESVVTNPNDVADENKIAYAIMQGDPVI